MIDQNDVNLGSGKNEENHYELVTQIGFDDEFINIKYFEFTRKDSNKLKEINIKPIDPSKKF